jgi:shikimate dehydrogenase
VYEALDVPASKLTSTLAALVAQGAAGNVTIPHKHAVFEQCAVRTPLAERVGAVNTFWTDGSRLCGDNTDVGGFQAAVVTQLARPPRGVLTLLGAGGSAAAVCAAADDWSDIEVRVISRSSERASALASRFGDRVRAVDDIHRALDGATVVVNATPLGMRDTDAMPTTIDLLPRAALIVDLVYRRGGTAWVNAARAAGVMAIDGLPMLIEQGALAFTRWFGFTPARDAMWSAVR